MLNFFKKDKKDKKENKNEKIENKINREQMISEGKTRKLLVIGSDSYNWKAHFDDIILQDGSIIETFQAEWRDLECSV